jgi:hypothetical protein
MLIFVGMVVVDVTSFQTCATFTKPKINKIKQIKFYYLLFTFKLAYVEKWKLINN